jgi:hypothetical protein
MFKITEERKEILKTLIGIFSSIALLVSSFFGVSMVLENFITHSFVLSTLSMYLTIFFMWRFHKFYTKEK